MKKKTVFPELITAISCFTESGFNVIMYSVCNAIKLDKSLLSHHGLNEQSAPVRRRLQPSETQRNLRNREDEQKRDRLDVK